MTATIPTPAAPTVALGAPSATRRVTAPRLVGPRLDGWLLGGAGIVAWVLMTQPFGFDLWSLPTLGGPVLWGMLALIGTHFGISYHLAYGQGREQVRARAGYLVAVPVVLGLAAIVVCAAAIVGSDVTAQTLMRVLLVAVFTLTGWHYVKQVYGITRLTAAMHGLPIDRTSAKVLRYGLYPVWFLDASAVWIVGSRPTEYGFEAGANVLPRITMGFITVGLAMSIVALVVTFARLTVVWRRLPPASMWTPVAAGVLWLTWSPDHVSAIVMVGTLHAVQYLVCAHRAELALAADRGESATVNWWACVFGAGLATGMLLSYWMPMWLGAATGSTALGLFPAALLFAFFNLHHYAVDAAIWRSGSGGHVPRILAAARR